MEFNDLKDLEERIMTSPAHNDPLVAIKNGSDSSHFQLMKSYIIDLKEKLSKAVISKKEYEKKPCDMSTCIPRPRERGQEVL